MKKRHTKFHSVWMASGLQGFFGEGYWFHKWLHFAGMFLWSITFVSKTTTLHPRAGQMPMKKDGITPQERFPRCVVVKFWKRVMLNAVSLSGPGLRALLDEDRWQRRTTPFQISIMSVEDTREKRLAEIRQIGTILSEEKSKFQTDFNIQLNVSSPNSGVNLGDIVVEAHAQLDALTEYGFECWVKIGFATTTPEQGLRISEHKACAGIVVTNTVPYGMLSDRIDWEKLFGSTTSPLIDRGFKTPGGLSGKPLLPLVVEWVEKARALGLSKHINAGGGILGPVDVWRLWRAKADSIFLGIIVTLNPHLVVLTILTAHILFRLGRRRKL